MVKTKQAIFLFLILFFLIFSFYPTTFELFKANHLSDPAREFILEHNYYWPDFNLYLSKIRQGFEGRLTALERYTSEPHAGSLIQEFYIVLGQTGRILGLDPNFAYQLGRIILSPILLLLIMRLVTYFFRKPIWQILAFIIILTSGSFPKFIINNQEVLQVSRYMEWWSNIDALQRITFIPHILFGQVVSFYLLYQLAYNIKHVTYNKLILYIILGNLVGFVFPPSLITLLATILIIIMKQAVLKETISECEIPQKTNDYKKIGYFAQDNQGQKRHKQWRNSVSEGMLNLKILSANKELLIFIIFSLPSLLYIFFLTKQLPWSALVEFHRTHPMMIPFADYILGTGPIFFLGLAGAIVSIIKRDRQYQPLIYWIIVTFSFAFLFTYLKDQSPLRFTQTGLFIPLGILGTYFFQEISLMIDAKHGVNFRRPLFEPVRTLFNNIKKVYGISSTNRLSSVRAAGQENLYLRASNHQNKFVSERMLKIGKKIFYILIIFYILGSLYMMTTSLNWQTTFITQRAVATIPLVPYPPQTMYPLKDWMNGIRFLRDNSGRDDVVLAEITAGNYIPAYSGNTVYFGQSNTVDYERKQREVWQFFKAEMDQNEAENFFRRGRIKYVFFGVQEKELSGGKQLENIYPFLKVVYSNSVVSIYQEK